MSDSAIETHIAEIDRTLLGVGYNYSGVLRPDGAEHQRAHEASHLLIMVGRVRVEMHLSRIYWRSLCADEDMRRGRAAYGKACDH